MRDYKILKEIPESESFIIEKKTKDFEGRKLITKEEHESTFSWVGPELEEERIKLLVPTKLNKKAQNKK